MKSREEIKEIITSISRAKANKKKFDPMIADAAHLLWGAFHWILDFKVYDPDMTSEDKYRITEVMKYFKNL